MELDCLLQGTWYETGLLVTRGMVWNWIACYKGHGMELDGLLQGDMVWSWTACYKWAWFATGLLFTKGMVWNWMACYKGHGNSTLLNRHSVRDK